MANNNYQCTSQQRILRLVDVMAGNEIDGLSTTELAKKMDEPSAAVYRDLQNLQAAQWAEQLEDGRWRLTVNAARLLRKITDNINAAMGRINRIHRDYLEV